MIYRNLSIVILSCIFLTSCFEDRDDVAAPSGEIKDFVYRGMNAFYLYKADVPELTDGRFETVGDLRDYHQQFDTPETFFNSLLFRPNDVDRFSFITSDFVALEQSLSGNRTTTGMRFALVRYPDNPTQVFGAVRYVIEGSNADAEGVTRGLIFNRINGTQITDTNFNDLLSADNYTIGLAEFDGTAITPLDQEISLSSSVVQEDPIRVATVIPMGGKTIGYLLYNSFLSDFDNDLNDVFADFNAQGVTDLVLDLRYNGGGSVNSAIILGSLIAGESTDQVYTTEQWNPDVQEALQEQAPDRLVNNFKDRIDGGAMLNSLNLDKVTIIATGSSASASELVINSLRPYAQVTHVGDTTVGKFQASITLYDSPDFSRSDINPSHKYAMQPLVLKSVNAAGNTDYFDGLFPDIQIRERYDNLGTLGDPAEPLLQAAIQNIMMGSQPNSQSKFGQPEAQILTDDHRFYPLETEMHHQEVLNKMDLGNTIAPRIE